VARRHGRFAALYINLTQGGTPEPIAFFRGGGMSAATDRVDVTAANDENKVYVSGIPDASGTADFWFDDASVQTYEAAVDGVARKFYFYPDRQNTPTLYWYGTAFFDFSVTTSVDGGVEGSTSWNAAGPIKRNAPS
jgi:hypothetical protein